MNCDCPQKTERRLPGVPTMRALLPLSFLLAVAGCDAAGESDAEIETEPVFQFETVSQGVLDADVIADGAPLPGVLVQIRALGEDGAPLAHIISVLSDDHGKLRTDFSVDPTWGGVELVVIKRGYQGLAGEDVQAQYGEFAPAAVLQLSVEDLDGLSIELEKVSQ